jgi:3-oxoacyl-[acyl-carrier-protein] synthase III
VSLPERSNILATAFRVPETAVTNDELAAVMDTSDDWIRKRSGIEQRHYVDNDQGSSALAEEAAREAIAKAGLGLGDIDLVVCATLSSDVDFPGNSSLVCERLGLAGVPAFDVSNQCSGFLYMLAIADQYIRTGGARHVLIIGSEVHSTGLDYTDRGRGGDRSVDGSRTRAAGDQAARRGCLCGEALPGRAEREAQASHSRGLDAGRRLPLPGHGREVRLQARRHPHGRNHR